MSKNLRAAAFKQQQRQISLSLGGRNRNEKWDKKRDKELKLKMKNEKGFAMYKIEKNHLVEIKFLDPNKFEKFYDKFQ